MNDPTGYATTNNGEIIDVYEDRDMAEAWAAYMRRTDPRYWNCNVTAVTWSASA